MRNAPNEAWHWLNVRLLHTVHDEQLAEHGGAAGVRDEGLLASALARAQQLAAYGDPDVADLAAAYAYGIVRNHPFVDGNKRSAFVAAQIFLRLNGSRIHADRADCVLTMLRLAAGEIDEAAYAAWLREHLAPHGG